MRGRTSRSFRCPDDIHPVVEAWAAKHGYRLKKTEGNRRFYHRGNWQLMAPACVQITQDGQNITLEAWVKADFYLLLSLLTGKQPEACLDSGGLVATIPRRIARAAVNELLDELGQKPIT